MSLRKRIKTALKGRTIRVPIFSRKWGKKSEEQRRMQESMDAWIRAGGCSNDFGERGEDTHTPS